MCLVVDLLKKRFPTVTSGIPNNLTLKHQNENKTNKHLPLISDTNIIIIFQYQCLIQKTFQQFSFYLEL